MKKLNLLSGGAVSPEDTFKAINGVIGAMNSLSDDIGDINNHSGTTSSSFNSSVIGTIGDVENWPRMFQLEKPLQTSQKRSRHLLILITI